MSPQAPARGPNGRDRLVPLLDQPPAADLGPFGDDAILYGKEEPALPVLQPGNGQAPSANDVTLGCAAASAAAVDAFHAAGLAAGGADEGAPGPRGHLPNAWAA